MLIKGPIKILLFGEFRDFGVVFRYSSRGDFRFTIRPIVIVSCLYFFRSVVDKENLNYTLQIASIDIGKSFNFDLSIIF